MNNKQAQLKSTSLSTVLSVIFGVGNVIKAVIDDNNTITFTDQGENKTNNIWSGPVPDGVVMYGPGQYKITIHEGSFDYELVETITPAQFQMTVDEALGNPTNNGALTVIFRHLLKDNGITEAVVKERVEELLKKHPIKDLSPEQGLEYVTKRLAGESLNWEDFTVGMGVLGVTNVTIAVR